MKKNINMQNTWNILGVCAAIFLAGELPAKGQGWSGPVLRPAITNRIIIPFTADSACFFSTNLWMAQDIENNVELHHPWAQDVRVIRFTEPGFQGQTNGPSAGNDVVVASEDPGLDQRQYRFETTRCCFQEDTAGVLMEITSNQVRSVYFGYVKFVAVYEPPVARDDNYTVDKNSTSNLLVVTNDTVNCRCFENSTSIQIVTNPAHGTAVLGVTGSCSNNTVRYVPTANYCGPDAFAYRLVSGGQTSNVAVVTIQVDNVNLSTPVAVNDIYFNTNRVCMDIPANRGVLVNDSDPDWSPTCGSNALTAVLVSAPSCAVQFQLRPDGSFTFCPCAGFCGDSFTYKVVDTADKYGTVRTSAVASVAIGYVNTIPPTANPDVYNMPDSTTLTVSAPGVLSNDVKDVCCASWTVLWTATPSSGFAGAGTGGFTYTPPTNFCGTTTAQYRVVACGLTSTPATVTINVNYTNQWAPVAVNDTSRPGYVVDQNTANNNTHKLCIAGYSAGVLGNDRDPDWSPTCGSNLLTVCANSVVVLTPAGGTLGQELTVNSDGTFCYKPPVDYCETFKFKYRACDEERQSNEAEVWIVVNPTNQCPYRNDKPNYLFPATGLWSVVSTDTNEYSTTFPKWCTGTSTNCLLSWITDDDWFTANKCGLTNVDWSLGVGLDDSPAVGVVVVINADDSMTVKYNFAELFANNWGPGIDEFFQDCGVWCYSSIERLLTYYGHQGICDDVRVDMNIDIKVADDQWDAPPPAPAIDWPGAFPLPWPTPEPPIPWATEVLEDSVDNLIPTLAILVPAYEANPNNCCVEGLIWDIVGAKWKVRCNNNAFVEELLVDFWPQSNFVVNVEGVDRTFAGAGSNVTTWAGGTAELGGEYIRYTPPANWPQCAGDYDFIPYRIKQVNTYSCFGTDVTVKPPYSYGYIKVRIINACDETVAQDDHVAVCQDADTPIPLSVLLANDYDLDFSRTNVVQFRGGSGIALLGATPPPAKTGPMGTNGPFTLVAYGADFQAAFANSATTTVIEGDTCEQDVLQMSAAVMKRTVGAGWPSWSHGYAGPVWHRPASSATIALPPNTAAFAMYLSPSNAGTHQFTVTDNNGASTVLSIPKSAGALGVAFYVGLQGDTLETISISAPTAGGFAMGEFYISQEPVGFVHDVGLGKGPDHGQLIVTTNVTDIGVIALDLAYRPAPGYVGLDSFSYELAVIKTCGGQNSTNFETAMVNVAVGAPNAVADELKDLMILQGQLEIKIPAEALLANDSPAGIVQVIGPATTNTPSGGTVTWIAASNMFVYRPTPAFHGCENFDYQIGYIDEFTNLCAGADNTDTAGATVYVRPVPKVQDLRVDVELLRGTTNFNIFKMLGTNGITNVCTTLHVVPASGGPVQDGRMTYNSVTGECIYTPDPHKPNTLDGFAYYLVDCGTATCDLVTAPITSAVKQVLIYVDYIPECTIVQNMTNVVARDEAAVVTVSAQDPEELRFGYGGIVAYGLVQQPANGTVVYLGGNQFRYTPNSCYYNWRTNTQVAAMDQWLWRAQNAAGCWATGSVSERVAFVAKAPVAKDDEVSVDRNKSITFDALANDIDLCNDGKGTWTVVSQNDSSHGTVVVLANKQIRYTPATNYCGEDSFTYLVKNGTAGSDYGTVHVMVNFVNIPPVAQSATYNTDEDVSFSGMLQATDLDNQQTCATTYPMAYNIVRAPSNGTVALDAATGVFTYKPSPNYFNARSNVLVKPLDTFQYVANDGYANSATATVSMQVNWINDPPVVGHDTYEVNENSTNWFSVTLNDLDVDSPAGQWSVSPVNGPAHGTLTVANGTNFVYAPTPFYVGHDSFSYRLDDGDGGSAEATVVINVKRAMRPIAYGQAVTINEDTVFVGQLTGFSSENLPLVFSRIAQPANGVVTIRSDGVFEYRPNANYYNLPTNGVRPLDSFMFQVADSYSNSLPATVTIGVNPVNDPPVAQDNAYQVNECSSNNAFAVTDNDTDVANELDKTKWTITVVNDSAHGTLAINGLNVTYTPACCYVGADSFSYRLNDGGGGADSDEATVAIDVKRAQLPTAQNQAITTDEDKAYVGQLVGANCDGKPLTFLRLTQPANGIVSVRNDGLFEYRPNPNYYNRRPGNDLALDSFTYQVTDWFGASAPAVVAIAVNWVNDKPVANDDAIQVNECSSNNPIAVTVNDSDEDSATSKWTVSAVGEPAHGTLAINGLSMIYTPACCYVGPDGFSYRLADGDGGSDEATVVINVKRAKLPVVEGQTFATLEDAAYVGQLVGSNCDGQTLSYSVVVQPANGTATVNPATGAFQYRPKQDYYNRCAGEADGALDSFTVRATDGFGASAPATISVAVQCINDPPIATPDLAVVYENASVDIAVVANDTDVDSASGQWTVSLVNDSAHGVVVLNGHVATYTPNRYFVGEDSFTYRVDDGDGGFDEATVTITVNQRVLATPLKVNCGGPAAADWAADYGWTATDGMAASTTVTIANAGSVPQKVYQTRRWASTLTYNFALPDSTYNVRLHFAELKPTVVAGQRIFAVAIEGQTVLPAYDIILAAGGSNRAVTVTIPNIQVANGLEIQGRALTGDAQFNGIEVWSAQSAPSRMSAMATVAPAEPIQAAPRRMGAMPVTGPTAWSRTGDGGWTAAPALIDNDPETISGGNRLMVNFGEIVPIRELQVLFQGDEPTKSSWMATADLREWFDLDLATNWPIFCRALYVDFFEENPAVRDILWEEDDALPEP